jgi:hypothetical protein
LGQKSIHPIREVFSSKASRKKRKASRKSLILGPFRCNNPCRLHVEARRNVYDESQIQRYPDPLAHGNGQKQLHSALGACTPKAFNPPPRRPGFRPRLWICYAKSVAYVGDGLLGEF